MKPPTTPTKPPARLSQDALRALVRAAIVTAPDRRERSRPLSGRTARRWRGATITIREVVP